MNNILDLNKTIAISIFNNTKYYWEVLPKIKEYILILGNSLDKDNYTLIKENVWIGKNVEIDKLSTIIGPAIIDDGTILRPGAFIRENVIIGKNCVIGNSTEIKNSIIFDNAQIPHYNYVGDSILGYHTHLGAGVVLSNLKNDKKNINIKYNGKIIETNLRKFGAIIGDNSDIGCNSVLCPGSIIGKNTSVYPLTRLRGVIDSDSIVKSENVIVRKENI